MKRLTHKAQLCPGEMQWCDIPGRYGPVKGWQCDRCGRTLRAGVHSLQHKAEPKSVGGEVRQIASGAWLMELD